MTNFFTSIYKNHHYINKCKTVSTLRTMGFFNGTVDDRERERERERCVTDVKDYTNDTLR